MGGDLPEDVDDDQSGGGVVVEPLRDELDHLWASWQGRGEVEAAGDSAPSSTAVSRFLSRLGVSSSAAYSTAPCSTGIVPRAMPPEATATPKPRHSQDLPSLGEPTRRLSPSASSPGTAHRGSGNSMRSRSAAVK